MASKFGRRLLVAALSGAALVAGLVATPAAATHAGEWVLKPLWRQYSIDVGATWLDERPDGWDGNTAEWSSDSGATWTASSADYAAGEAGTDSSDGPNDGQFRAREPHLARDIAEGDPRWSTDAGGTWTDQGAAEPSGFNFGTREWSSDSGATWTATNAAYLVGEAGTDSRDGPDAGQFRQRAPYQRQRTWVCSGAESVFTEMEDLRASDIAGIQPCLGQHVGRTFTSNVDDGIEPPGDWCVVGASAIICRGEGFTYREARRELRF